MSQTKSNNQLIIGLIIGFFIGLLVIKACNTTKIIPPIIIPTKVIKDSIRIDSSHFNNKIDSLNKKIDKEKLKSLDLKESYGSLKQENRILENYIKQLETDSNEEFNNAVNDYIINNQKKDSLCDSLSVSYEKQSSLKDSIIVNKDSLIFRYKSYLSLSLNQQDKLLNYSKQLKKEITKQKTNNILWKAGTIIVAGLIIKQQLKK